MVVGKQIAEQQFQSTPSVWRVTENLIHLQEQRTISIHTLRVEGDFV